MREAMIRMEELERKRQEQERIRQEQERFVTILLTCLKTDWFLYFKIITFHKRIAFFKCQKGSDSDLLSRSLVVQEPQT